MTTSANFLQVAGLSKSFGANEVLKSIDLTVTEGEVIGLIGPPVA